MNSLLKEVSVPTLIAEGTCVRGELTFESGTQVFGVIDGDIVQQSLESIQVGKSGWIHGTIRSRGPVVIEGRVEGNIQSSTKIKLCPTANVKGAISAPAIEIRPGAVFEGELKMKPSEEKPRLLKRVA